MKINNFQVDLTDVSAKTEVLHNMQALTNTQLASSP